MTDTGQVPGEGLPENAGMVEQPGVPAPGTYTYLSDSPASPAEDEDLLLPGAQGAWGNEIAPPPPEPVVETVHEPGPHETAGRDSGSVDLRGVRLPGPQQPVPAAPRRPLHLGPPIPDLSAGPVRSLADRGPADLPTRQAGPPTLGPEYLDVPRAREAVAPPPAAPWGAQAAVGAGATTAETVVPSPEPVDAAQAVVTRVAAEAVAVQDTDGTAGGAGPVAGADGTEATAHDAAGVPEPAAGPELPTVRAAGPDHAPEPGAAAPVTAAPAEAAAPEYAQVPGAEPAGTPGAGVPDARPDGVPPAARAAGTAPAVETAVPEQVQGPEVSQVLDAGPAADHRAREAGEPPTAGFPGAGDVVPEDVRAAGVSPDVHVPGAGAAVPGDVPVAEMPPAADVPGVAGAVPGHARTAEVPPAAEAAGAEDTVSEHVQAAEVYPAVHLPEGEGAVSEHVQEAEVSPAAQAPGAEAAGPENAPSAGPEDVQPDEALGAAPVPGVDAAVGPQEPRAPRAPGAEAAEPGYAQDAGAFPDVRAADARTTAPEHAETAQDAQAPGTEAAAQARSQEIPASRTPADPVVPTGAPVAEPHTTAPVAAVPTAESGPGATAEADPAQAVPEPTGTTAPASGPTGGEFPAPAPAGAPAAQPPTAVDPEPLQAPDGTAAAVPAAVTEAVPGTGASAPPAVTAAAAADTAPPAPAPADADLVRVPQQDPGAVTPGPASDRPAPVDGTAPATPHPAPTPPQGVTVPAEPDAEPAQNADDMDTRGAGAEPETRAETEPARSAGPAAPGYDDAEREAVLKVMRERRDIRNGFRGDPIPHEVLLRVLEAAHTAPSVGHSQPWDFVVIRSAETRRGMHELAMRQRDAYARSLPKGRAKQFKELKIEAILDTPVNIVVTADPTRGGRHTLGRHTQPQMAPYSSALAVENLWLAARAEGLGVGWVSFFDEREMVRALGLPEHLEVVAYLCVGYVDEFPDEPELMQAGWSKRRPLSWVVHEETYGRRALPGEDPHDLLAETVAQIRPLDAKALGEAWERQKRMTKPAGALGMLEIISAQLSGLSRKCPPPVPEPAALAIFAGDHGVHAQGVTPWPQEVTAQMVANFLGGGAVCNAFAAQVGAEICVVDVGVSSDLPATPGLLPRKIRAGTSDMTTGPAMSREEAKKAIEVGIETARDLVAAGNKALLTGEMGIANTTASAALISVYTGADPAEVTGRGTGINDETLARKTEVVRRALEAHQPDPADPIGVLAAVGGFEHAAMVGLLLGGASLRTPVILDGVSAGAAALVARAIAPEVLAACIAGHRSAEPGHVAALNKLGLRPLVDLDLRLGEGTGALLALPLVQSTARAMHEVATFDSAGVTEK
ncbi:nicotinate-nucleotide--dimethylbenzimidazole phosphoribosyltransferase [Streptomyces sp. NPDC016626]|uniref:nicotinate-nucleotide--dimethylbenzimidazole phosphoribosyltransferase n=1 Tax=Streptomyces sp. NPDC016626 TaxID=3364968 RepID=UPI0036F93743